LPLTQATKTKTEPQPQIHLPIDQYHIIPH